MTMNKNMVPNNRILLVSNGLVHPSWRARRWLKRSLQTMPGYVFQQVGSLEALPQLDASTFKALVLYFHHKTISSSALSRLDEFVRRGGGVLAIHSATASFKQEPRYFEILGGRFRMHGAVQIFTVHQTRATDEVFGALAPFQIKDELYVHELGPEITIHFETMHEGQSVPVVWTRLYGAGHVCYAMPGHTVESMKHPTVHDILRRGLMWVCQS
jgi:type 1 glutamine amidotransferase